MVVDPATGPERAVAVKVQYPGVGDAIEADLRNASLLGAMLKQGFGGLDPDDMVAEIKERLIDELDYSLEADNQQALRRLLPRPPVHPRSRRAGIALDVARADQRAGQRGDLAGDARMVAGRARPRRRMLVPFRVPQPVRHAPLQRRPASRQLPLPRRRQGDVPRLRTGQALHRRRDGDVHRHGQGGRVRTRRPDVPAHRRGRRHAAPRRTGRRRRRSASTSASSTRASRRTRSSRGRRSTPAGSCATRSIAPVRSRSTRRCRVRSCSSSGSTSGCTRCSASCARRATTGEWPRSCGRSCEGPPSTPMAEAEQPWLTAATRP